MDLITISELEVSYCVGVTDEERATPQRLLLSIELLHDFAIAASRDDLWYSIDYQHVSNRLLALGEKPDGADWMIGANTPKAALATLQLRAGAYEKKHGDATGPLPTTSWALSALRDKPFTTRALWPGVLKVVCRWLGG